MIASRHCYEVIEADDRARATALKSDFLSACRHGLSVSPLPSRGHATSCRSQVIFVERKYFVVEMVENFLFPFLLLLVQSISFM